MSPLWPERISAGLFPGRFWLEGRRAAVQHSLRSAPLPGTAPLSHGLEALLDERADAIRKGSRIALTVSDGVAAVIALPWQDDLHGTDELEAYARICFEKQGLKIDEGWIIRTVFRHYRATGIAYALPRAWLTDLLQLLGGRGLKLTGVLPVTAAAFCGQRIDRGGGRTLLLLREETRISALIYGLGKLQGYDVEPATTSGRDAGLRLLRRISGGNGDIARLLEWSSESPAQAKPEHGASLCLPGTEVRALPRTIWS